MLESPHTEVHRHGARRSSVAERDDDRGASARRGRWVRAGGRDCRAHASLRRACGTARPRSRDGAGRDLRRARAERGRQNHAFQGARDARRTADRHGDGLRRGCGPASGTGASPARRRVPAPGARRQAHGAREPALPCGSLWPRRGREHGARARRCSSASVSPSAPRTTSRASPAASRVGSSSPRDCCTSPISCSSTSPRPASIPARAATSSSISSTSAIARD